MKAPFNTWTHPASGELRVYCNTPYPGVKIWMERRDDSYTIKGWYDYKLPHHFRQDGRCWAINYFMERLPEAGYAGPIDFDSIADFAKSKRCRA